MRKFTGNCISLVLTLSMLFSLCGCNNNKKTAEAETLCTSFCEDIKAGNVTNLMGYLSGSDVTEESLKELIEPSGLNSEESAFVSVIRDSIIYSVQEPVYDYKAKLATVYLVFGVADYSSEEAMAAENVSEFSEALSTMQNKVITIAANVDFSGELPVIVNAKEIINEVYAFSSADLRVMPGKLSDFYTGANWVLAPNDSYLNTDVIGVRAKFSKDLSGYRCVPGITYSVYRDGEAVFASDLINLEEDSVKLEFSSEMAGEDGINEDLFLVAGNYKISVSDEFSNEICSLECVVENKEIPADTIKIANHKEEYYLSNLVYEVMDNDFMAGAMFFKSGWWDYDGTSVGKSAFGSNTKTLGFSLAVGESNDSELYYEYYYSEKSDFAKVNGSEPVYQGSCKPTVYDDQACYDLDYSADKFKPGFYGVVVYSDASKKHIVFVASCLVVKETSKDVIKG